MIRENRERERERKWSFCFNFFGDKDSFNETAKLCIRKKQKDSTWYDNRNENDDDKGERKIYNIILKIFGKEKVLASEKVKMKNKLSDTHLGKREIEKRDNVKRRYWNPGFKV